MMALPFHIDERFFMIQVSLSLGINPKLPNGKYVIGRNTVWIVNGEKHRDRGPAETRKDGYKAYYNRGKLHREKGPAIIHPNGDHEYWLDGQLIRIEKGVKRDDMP